MTEKLRIWERFLKKGLKNESDVTPYSKQSLFEAAITTKATVMSFHALGVAQTKTAASWTESQGWELE